MGKVFAILDAKSHSASVCDHAAWAAMRLGLPLSLMHVLDVRLERLARDASDIDFPEREAFCRQIEEAADQYRKVCLTYGQLWRAAALRRAQSAGVQHCEASAHPGSLSDALTDVSNSAPLVVTGLHHFRATPGGTAGRDFAQELAIRSVSSPVLACGDRFEPPVQFMLAYDGLLTASNAVATVASGALLKNATCHLVMVAQPGDADTSRLASARMTLEAAGYRVISTVLQGEPHVALCAYAQSYGIGLLVMGAYRQARGLTYPVDGTLANMLRTCPASCLILN